jgi:hypothetical protein
MGGDLHGALWPICVHQRHLLLICVESCLLWRPLLWPPREFWNHRGTQGFSWLAVLETQRLQRFLLYDLCVFAIFLTNMPAASSTCGASERTTAGGPCTAGSGDDAPVPGAIFDHGSAAEAAG